MILDVACGMNPHGDINIDTGPIIQARDSGKWTRADVYASALKLPFKDNSFNVVHFIGLLHHVEYPKDAFAECVRVAKDLVIGQEPTFLNPGAYLDPFHKFNGFKYNQIAGFIGDSVPHFRIEIMVPQITKPWKTVWQIIAMKRHPEA